MDPLSLFLMAGGMGLEGFAKYRSLKKQKKDLKIQAMEAEAEAGYALRMSSEKQLELARSEDFDIGRSMAGTGKAGLRLGGSATRRREAISTQYGRQAELIRLETGEQVRRLSLQAILLRKKAKEAGKAAKWSMLTGMLGTGFAVGSAAYGAGMFSGLGDVFGELFNSDWFSKVKKAASTGSGAYGGTRGGGPTGGASRSMIG